MEATHQREARLKATTRKLQVQTVAVFAVIWSFAFALLRYATSDPPSTDPFNFVLAILSPLALYGLPVFAVLWIALLELILRRGMRDSAQQV
jgi:hypothetical protein